MNENRHHVDFGFQRIDPKHKPEKVKGVFSSVADKYDVMNDVMSLGLHHLWKDRLVEELLPGKYLLDVAGGTADIARRYIAKGGRRVLICDLTLPMLQNGQARIFDDAHDPQKFCFVTGDAENLPFKKNSFDYITIAFGLRNMTFKEKALRSCYECLTPGAKLLILEFSQVAEPHLAALYDWWSFAMLPRLGRWIADDSDSYQYLAESIRTFAKPETLQQMMRDAGFTQIRCQTLSFGIVAIHSGFKTSAG